MTHYEKLIEALADGDLHDVRHYAAEMQDENARLRKWIEELNILAENAGDHREWLGSEIGWLYPGCAAYYARPRREDILSNDQGHQSTAGKGLP
jgi:hypothetical protein